MVLLAAVDDAEEDRPVIEEARRLADALGEEVTVVHVLSQRVFRSLEQEAVEEAGRTIEIDAIRERATAAAEELAAAVDADVNAEGLVGTPAEEILQYADEQDASYIVIGGRRRTPIGKVLFGSVTQSVLVSATMPVVTVMRE